MKELMIFGKNVSSEEKEDVRKFIISERELAKEPIAGEYEKTEEDYAIIELLNSYIQEELDGLGVLDKQEVVPGQVHLFPAVTYGQRFSKAGSSAFCNSMDNDININADTAYNDGRLQFFRDMLHEMIHAFSVNKFYLKNKNVEVYRSGYRSINPSKDHEHFKGLNEAMIEKIAIEILNKHRKDIVAKFSITKNEERKEAEYFCYYHSYIAILEVIVSRISQTKGEEKKNVWKKLKKGLFTGEMMHLREIEKILGRNSLAVLDILDTDRMHKQPEEMIAKVRRYFETNSKEEQEKIAKELLSHPNTDFSN